MAKTRVHELARELDMTTKELVDLLASWGHEDKKHAVSALEDDLVAKVRAHAGNGKPAAKAPAKPKKDEKAAAKSAAPVKDEPAKGKDEKAKEDKAAKPAKSVSSPMAPRKAQPMAPLKPLKAQPAAQQAPAAKSSGGKKAAPQFRQVTRATVAQEQAIRAERERVERERLEAERKAREEIERQQREQLEQLQREEMERQARAEAERRARDEAARQATVAQRQEGVISTSQPVVAQAVAAAPTTQPTVTYPRQAAGVAVHPGRPPGPGRPAGPGRPGGGPGQGPRPGGPGRPGGRGKGRGKGRGRATSEEREARSRRNQGLDATPTLPLDQKVRLLPGLTVKDLADQLGVRETDVIKKLFLKGVLATINQSLQIETAEMIVTEYGYEVEIPTTEEEDQLALKLAVLEEDPKLLKARPPVVTIMGHVDHGKTSLLDAIRRTNVTEGEAGGITQHIGAYQVEVNDRLVSFLDTPGHEAFTSMRARGANVTDVVVLVVAADDGIMPQTIEAISHAKAASVPIIVAINKIDKPTADTDRVKQQLTEHGLVAEEWGGTTVMVPVSAKQRTGLQDLLEMILLVADMEDLKANPERQAQGVIIESQLSRGKGAVATVLVQSGTLEVGDTFSAGATWGKVRAMIDHRGKRMKKAGPSMPVEISGFNGVPAAGDVFRVMDTEKEAKAAAERRQQENAAALATPIRHVSLDNVSSLIREGKLKELNLVVKADVAGSCEALQQSLAQLSRDKVQLRVIHAGTGDISESDVKLADVSNALVIAFNTKVAPGVREIADAANVDIRHYEIIYKVLEDIEAALEGLLEPEMVEVVMGKATVRAVFTVGKTGAIAGLYITEGLIQRNNQVRLYRDDKLLFTGKIDALKRFKDDVREVRAGYECGLTIEKWNDYAEGDVIEAFAMQAKKA